MTLAALILSGFAVLILAMAMATVWLTDPADGDMRTLALDLFVGVLLACLAFGWVALLLAFLEAGP